MKKALTTGLLLCIAISITVASACALSNAGDGTWQYQREITIHENSGELLTDYQVLIELSSSDFPTGAQSDGADIRFTDADNTKLSYWIEEYDYSGKHAKVWVKVPSISAGGTSTIRMYYGNVNALSASNGDSAFEFFDDFDSSERKVDWKWNQGDSKSSTYTISNSKIEINNSGLNDPWDHDSWIEATAVYAAIPYGLTNYVIEAKSETNAISGDMDNFQTGIAILNGVSDNNWYAIGYLRDAPDGEAGAPYHILCVEGCKDSHCIENDLLEINSDETIWFRIDVIGKDFKWYWKHEIEDEWSYRGLYKDKFIPENFGIWVKNWGDNSKYKIWVDYIFLHKYTSPEPTVTISSAKETVDINVALNADVTLHGGSFFTDGWSEGQIVSKETIVDGVFLPRGTQWDQGAVWWDNDDGVDRYITIDLGDICMIKSFVVQADDNDAYLLYYWDPASGWQLAWAVPNYDVYPDPNNWGMQTRPNPDDDTERYILPSAIVTNKLKFECDMSDNANCSVSEIQAYGTQITVGKLTQLTTDPANEWQPAWSPDGEEIVFKMHSNPQKIIKLTLADSSELQLATHGWIHGNPCLFGEPHYSPDGTKIIYGKDDCNGWVDMYVVNSDGSSDHCITCSDPGENIAATWYPTENIIIYANAPNCCNMYPWDTISIKPDGSGKTTLVSGVLSEGYHAMSPDESKLLYSAATYQNSPIWMMKIKDLDTDAVTDLDRGLFTMQTQSWQSQIFSPDGSKILYHSDENGNWDIYTINADGTGKTQLTTDTSDDRSAYFSPDGSKIVFVSDRTGNNDIWIMDADGSNKVQLTTNTAGDMSPTWSPDGSKIVFVSDRSGNYDIWVMALGGITHTPTPTPTPTVTPPLGEPGSSFDNPITIYKEGTVRDKLSEGETIYYKIWLNKEKDVTLTLDFGYLADIISNSNLDIYLCNPDREEVSASTGENWNAFEVDEQIEYNTGNEEGYYYIKIVNLHSQPHYEPEEFSLGVNVKSPLPPTVIEPTPVLLGTYALELSAPGSNIIDGKIGEIKVFGSSNKHRIEIELDTPVVRLYNAENRYLGDYDVPLTFHGSDSVILLSFDEKVHMNLDGIAFYDSDGNQIEQGGGLLDALLMDIISIGLGKIIPVPIPTSTLGVLLESQDEMLVPDILSDDRTHDIKSVVIAPKRGEVKKVVVFFSKGLDGTPVDNTLHLYVHVKGTGYPSGLSFGQYIPPIIVGTKYINDIPLVS